MNRKILFIAFLIIGAVRPMAAQSVARKWSEVLLTGIRNDFARPNVHARNLFHVSAAIYDAWAAYDSVAKPFLLGNTIGTYTSSFVGVSKPVDVEEAREEAISFAAYRILKHRFDKSPDKASTYKAMNDLMDELGYDTLIIDVSYRSGNPAHLGNYIAQQYINFGITDRSNELADYANRYYKPVNKPFFPEYEAFPSMKDPNRWQSLALTNFVDQSGNPIPNGIPEFLGPEWGEVVPFALKKSDLIIKNRDGNDYWIYHDPGPPSKLNSTVYTDSSDFFKWAFELVSVYSSQLSTSDSVVWNISPGAMRMPDTMPSNFDGFKNFYNHEKQNFFDTGFAVNPRTSLPYADNFVLRGDFTRALAEFWADGPDSETPPGHWFTLLNYVNEHPKVTTKYKGIDSIASKLEWDVKSYLIMGGAMHDCAVSAWGVKGYYDFLRPISAIRYLASRGQCTDAFAPNYAVDGIHLLPGFIEQVRAGDPLAGSSGENINKIKLFAWKGHDFISDPKTDIAGVGWILAEDWWPYQRPTSVTPPFAGYVSGHSTYSMAGAEVLTMINGDSFFPGGLGEFDVEQNKFLVFEEGPTQSFKLQWAQYRDAANQSGLSRIWGGIHPPIDDIPGRRMGVRIGQDAVTKAEKYFYQDKDKDGVLSFMDCDDTDPSIYPNAPELCDGKDNDCNGFVDDNIPYYPYFADVDRDGYGSNQDSIVSCVFPAPKGFVTISGDCDDRKSTVYPGAVEVEDNGVDEDCNGRDLSYRLKI
ncbi:MAG: hypothetical protein ACI9NN_001464, partial [Bacteroidia bacterium]